MARSVGSGRFELGEVAGQGGMGTVYRAMDRETEGVVAIKILHGATDALRLRFDIVRLRRYATEYGFAFAEA